MSQGHGQRDRQGQADTGLHLGQAADEMPLETEAVVDAVVDPLQGVAAVVTALPAGTAVRVRHEEAPIVIVGAVVDSIVSYEMVTAEGEIVRVDDSQDPALFWGMRGKERALASLPSSC